MVINHNIMAMNTQRQINNAEDKKDKSTEKLSSGYKINRSADDAAGLSISERMRKQIRGLSKGYQNDEDGKNLLGVADGALEEVHSLLDRMKELSVQAANDTNTVEDRSAIQKEIEELEKEVDRIGKTTTFNTKYIFRIPEAESYDGSITQLITSPGADSGYLKESYAKGGYYYPSASLDFSHVNSRNIVALNGGGFSFTCSQSCSEVFDIKFYTDGTPSSATNLSGRTTHKYNVDISACKNGTDIVNTIYDFISNNLPDTASASSSMGDLMVSHSNNLAKSGTKIIVYDNTHSKRTVAEAENYHPTSSSSKYGAITYTLIQYEGETPENFNEYNIQCSSDEKDNLKIHTPEVNLETLGLVGINVESHNLAGKSMEKIEKAIDKVSRWRTDIGAEFNRLEHSILSNGNYEQNLSEAESGIRDTDMAKEVVENSKSGILLQVGQAMLAQANSTPNYVIKILE